MFSCVSLHIQISVQVCVIKNLLFAGVLLVVKSPVHCNLLLALQVKNQKLELTVPGDLFKQGY